MSSCQGELANKAFRVRVVDEEGRVIVNETIYTLRNGFFEIWLPRNRRFELTAQGANRKAKSTIETFGDSNTCITTLQLR
jgi:hypothetical protein